MYQVTVQRAVPKNSMLSPMLLKRWAKAVLKLKTNAAEIAIRIVDIAEMTELNICYRHKKGPTNVLSFPFDTPEEVKGEIPFLGDIIICAEVVNQEANEQGKTMEAHWAHMIVHGSLHLLGYDHETDTDAAIMEPQEINILKTLGFPNPYQ